MADFTPTPSQTGILQLVEEQATVYKTEVETGRVRISTHVEERTERVQADLRLHGVAVERVPINQIVEVEPMIREEGGVLIYPVVEEILVKRLLLKEELRITRTSTLEHVDRDVTLRTLHADVQRTSTPPKT